MRRHSSALFICHHFFVRSFLSPMPESPHLRCPICKKAVKSTDPDYPFCSERCRTIDLGKWASGQYVISSPVKDIADEFEVESDASRSDDDE